MKIKKWLIVVVLLLLVSYSGLWVFKKFNFNSKYAAGQAIDSLNNVYVYYNGGVAHTEGRNMTADSYNLGMKYQCVEFVKRYYYQYLHHKMPDTYGNAKDFFDNGLPDSARNEKRNLIQYRNGSCTKPAVNDLVIFDGSIMNKYGHVAIVSSVSEKEIEIIQQNPGPFGSPRVKYPLIRVGTRWRIEHNRLLGWLRKE